MPVSFLTPEQERRYGRFIGVPTREQLDRHFHLDDTDLAMIGRRRWDHMRLGFAVQLGTVRFLGTFLADPTAVPAEVVAVLARQIGVVDPACLGRYRDGRVRWHHAAEIREAYGYREFAEPAAQWRLLRWLYALCWTGTDRPTGSRCEVPSGDCSVVPLPCRQASIHTTLACIESAPGKFVNGLLSLKDRFLTRLFLNPIQFETRSASFPSPPGGRRSKSEAMGFKLDGV
jgi:hypothetical protein